MFLEQSGQNLVKSADECAKQNQLEEACMPAELTTLCYLERDGRYLMLHRVSKKHDVNKDKWIGVGGHCEENESPEDCLLREVREETGYTLTDYRMRGVVTFLSGKGDYEYMFLYTASGWTGEAAPCDEGTLEWVDKEKVWKLNIWEGDKIFFRLMDEDAPFFSLKLVYDGTDRLVQAVLNGKDMELFDIADENGKPTGRVTERGVAHREGTRHHTVHMWIVRPDPAGGEVPYEVLLQKRSSNKDSNPGAYDISSAGHMQAGAGVMESAIREIGEELGIRAEADDFVHIGQHSGSFEAVYYGKPFRDSEVAEVFLYTKPVNTEKLTLQKSEVESVRWMPFDALYSAVKEGTIPNCIYLSELDMMKRYLSGVRG